MLSAILVGLGLVEQFLQRVPEAKVIATIFSVFNLDAENAVPAWYSAMLMAGSAALILVVAAALRDIDPLNSHRWRVLAYIFFFLSIDEAISIHERMTVPLREAFGFSGVLYYSWVVVAAPLLVGGVHYFFPLVKQLVPQVRRRVIAAGAMYLIGAVGLELAAGYILTNNLGNDIFAIAFVAEESLEIFGLTLFVSALVLQLALFTPRVTFRIVDQ